MMSMINRIPMSEVMANCLLWISALRLHCKAQLVSIGDIPRQHPPQAIHETFSLSNKFCCFSSANTFFLRSIVLHYFSRLTLFLRLPRDPKRRRRRRGVRWNEFLLSFSTTWLASTIAASVQRHPGASQSTGKQQENIAPIGSIETYENGRSVDCAKMQQHVPSSKWKNPLKLPLSVA